MAAVSPPHAGRPGAPGARRYLSYADRVRECFGGRVQRVSLDGGFTCPNRDGTLGIGGCSYCDNASFSPVVTHARRTEGARPTNPEERRLPARAGEDSSPLGAGESTWTPARAVLPIRDQLEAQIPRLRRRYPRARGFLAYFQPFSNTYAPVAALRRLYGEALDHPEVRGLVVATRPDCIDGVRLDLLAELAQRAPVTVEIGVESVRDDTLRRIGRGHDFATAAGAIRATHERGLEVGAHLILGLPGETRSDHIEALRVLSTLPIDLLKLHQLHVVRGTALAAEYRRRPFPLLCGEAYVELLVDLVERVRPDIAIQRLFADVPARYLLTAPWVRDLSRWNARFEARLAERQTWQGRLWEEARAAAGWFGDSGEGGGVRAASRLPAPGGELGTAAPRHPR